MYACLQKQVTYVATLFNSIIYLGMLIKVLIQMYSKQLIVKDTTSLPLKFENDLEDDGSFGIDEE